MEDFLQSSIFDQLRSLQKGIAMSSSRRPRRRTLRAAVLGAFAGAAALGLTIAGVGSASAGNIWYLGFITSTIPAGTGSIGVANDKGGFECVDGPFTGWQTTTRAHAWGDVGFTVTPYGDIRCQGNPTGSGVGYRFNTNVDQKESGNGSDCPQIAIGVSQAQYHWLNCGLKIPVPPA